MRLRAPSFKRITAAPVVGYFLDHANYAKNVKRNRVEPPTKKAEVTATGQYSYEYPHTGNYSSFMEIVYRDQNVTEALSTDCLAAFPDEPHYCTLSQAE